MWHAFGAHVNKAAKVLQLIKSSTEQTINNIADAEIDAVHQTFQGQAKFVLVAHSFGTLIALKMASLLEKRGQIGQLILLDGSPSYLKRLAQVIMRTARSNEEIDDELITIMFDHFGSTDTRDRFMAKLTACDQWSAKVQIVIDFVSDEFRSTYSVEYLTHIIVAVLNRLKVVVSLHMGTDRLDEIVETKLRSTITLVRPTQASFSDLGEDYGLQAYTDQPTIVHYIEGNHLSILENTDLADTINRITDTTLST